MANFGNLIRGNWKVNNSDDVARKYEIEAEAQITGNGDLTALVNGVVRKDGATLATFNAQYGAKDVPTFVPQDVTIEDAQVAYGEVLAFASAVADKAKNNPPFTQF